MTRRMTIAATPAWRIGIVLALASCASGPAASDPGTPAPEFRALRYPPLPPSVEEVSGLMLDEHAGAEYAVAHVRRGTEEFLWLERLVARDSAGRPTWEVLDALRLPVRPSGYHLALGTCTRTTASPQADPALLAFVKGDADDEQWRDVSQVWRADEVKGRIVPELRTGVTCENEGYGL
jgi:hypothetical protein